MALNPDFSRRFVKVLKPKSGRAGEFVTLRDAAEMIGVLEGWRQRRPVWEKASEDVLRAATTGRKPISGKRACS